MIAVDTNVLVHAHRRESRDHLPALERLASLAEGDVPWGLPVFCLAEFVRVVTHPRVFDPATRLSEACEALEGLLEAPTVQVLCPGPRFPTLLVQCLKEAEARGNLAFDAQIAAVCLEHGAFDLISLDRDFARFSRLRRWGLESPVR